MKDIFIGLIFAIFSLKINFGLSSVDLLPNFIGFYFILKGFKELHPVNSSLYEVFGYIKIAIIYSVFTFAFRLFGFFSMMGIAAVFFELIEAGLMIYIVYKLIDDFRKTETESGFDLNTRKLEQMWNINTCCLVISVVAGMIPQYPVVAVPVYIANLVAAAVFIYEFSKTRSAYYASLEK